jgi:Uncharacterized protein conserved in bacteria (DUF2252)
VIRGISVIRAIRVIRGIRVIRAIRVIRVPPGLMNIVKATRSYEAWLATHTDIVRADVRIKHKEMKRSPFVFLRATFYRWAQRWPQICEGLTDAPLVLAVGDLHLENFGTWRDDEGRLAWGVNDPDEAFRLPYTHDLVRLATSAILARREGALALSRANICAAILRGYADALACGGEPIVLAEAHRWLARIAAEELKDPAEFWAKLSSARPGPRRPPAPLRDLLQLPRATANARIRHRRAGVGSLGRPRFVALGSHHGGFVAREGKAVVPSACVWATEASSTDSFAAALFRNAVRDHDPFFVVRGGWSVRRLSPDCTKIDVSRLPGRRFEKKLLHAMGWETANVHLGTRGARLRRDLDRRPSGWLDQAAHSMADDVADDWKAWRKKS